MAPRAPGAAVTVDEVIAFLSGLPDRSLPLVFVHRDRIPAEVREVRYIPAPDEAGEAIIAQGRVALITTGPCSPPSKT